MKAWHDYPVVKDKTCPKCHKGPVHVMLTTGQTLRLQCRPCGHAWEEPERRRPRKSELP